MTKMALQPIFSSSTTSCQAETDSDADGGHNVENVVLCSFAHHACSPLLEGNLQAKELCNVALTCHFALDVLFLCTE